MCNPAYVTTDHLVNPGILAAETLSDSDNPNRVTVGMKGKVTTFTYRPTNSDDEGGYIRLVDAKGIRRTVSGYVPGYGKGGKVFYAYPGTLRGYLAE